MPLPTNLLSFLQPIGRGNAPGGLVKNEALRIEARDAIVKFGIEELKLELLGLAPSPIKGKEKGNVEYLSLWRKSPHAK